MRNALLNALRDQHPGKELSSQSSFSPSAKGAGLVIGGGATTRSAAHALTLLGLTPIFLINRDPEEVRVVMEAMPHLSKKGGLIHLKNPDDVEKYLVGPDACTLLMAVGAIRMSAIVTRNTPKKVKFQLNFSLAETKYEICKIPYIDMRPLPPTGGKRREGAGLLYMVVACFRN